MDHLWGWREVIRQALGHDAVYLAARRDGRLVGVLPLVLVRSRLFGRAATSLPFLNYGGILADDQSATAALVQAARGVAADFRASHVELRHSMRICPDLPCREHKVAMTMPLPGSPEDFWRATDRKVRNQVRKAQGAGLQTANGGLELVDEFYEVFARNMRDLGTPVYSRALFAMTLRVFPDRVRVFLVRRGSTPVAGGILVGFRGRVMNPWASSAREFRHLSPNMLLYWTMIEHAIASGAVAFDFGRSSKSGGTYHFKRQWGATESPLFWEYILLGTNRLPDQGPDNPKFGLLIDLWRRLPLRVANVLGPTIARGLP